MSLASHSPGNGNRWFVVPRFSVFRRKTNWVVALVCEMMAPVLRAYARRRCAGAVSDPRSWARVLLVGDNHIGDILYRSCSLEALKQGLPECEFYYLAAENTAPLLEGNPALRAVLPWARSDSPLDLLPCHEAELKALRFDAVLSTNAIRYWPELLLALRLKVPNRVGYTYKGFSGWVTHPMPIDYPQSYPAYFRGYVAALTGQAPSWPLRPRIYPTITDKAEVEVVWGRLGLEPGRPVLACFLTTRQGLGCLPPGMIGEALLEIKRRSMYEIVLMGAKQDAAVLNSVNEKYGLGARVLAGELGLRALSVFLARCAAVLTTDSGPRHLANAAGIPVFFFRNLWSSCVETGCYSDTELDLCPPGIERLDDAGQRHVLEAISPLGVAARVVGGLCAKVGQS